MDETPSESITSEPTMLPPVPDLPDALRSDLVAHTEIRAARAQHAAEQAQQTLRGIPFRTYDELVAERRARILIEGDEAAKLDPTDWVGDDGDLPGDAKALTPEQRQAIDTIRRLKLFGQAVDRIPKLPEGARFCPVGSGARVTNPTRQRKKAIRREIPVAVYRQTRDQQSVKVSTRKMSGRQWKKLYKAMNREAAAQQRAEAASGAPPVELG
jgi:hypothetical protein